MATPKSVEEMSLEECQREIASIRERTCADENCDDNHWPLATLDTVAALMPEGWRVSIMSYSNTADSPEVWCARGWIRKQGSQASGLTAIADTELLARFRLLLLILRKDSK